MLTYQLESPHEPTTSSPDTLLFLPGLGQSISLVEEHVRGICRDLLRVIVQPRLPFPGNKKFRWADADPVARPLIFDSEQMQASIEEVIKLAAQLRNDHQSPRLYLAGFSQGAVVAAHALDQAPDLFSGAVLSHAILVPSLLAPGDTVFPPVRILQARGGEDTYVTSSDRLAMLQWLERRGSAGSGYEIVSGQHAFTPHIAKVIETTIQGWRK